MSQTALLCCSCGKGARNSKHSLMVCGKCRNAQYCDSVCQKQHWKHGGHKQSCKKLHVPISIQVQGDASAGTELPIALFASMSHEDRAACVDSMQERSKKSRKPRDLTDSAACWDAVACTYALVLSYIVDSQWSMASKYIVKCDDAFVTFQNSFAGGFDMARDGEQWHVQAHMDSMQQNALVVNLMLLTKKNEAARLKVLEMPIGRERANAVYHIVTELILEQDGWKKQDTREIDKKLQFIVSFDEKCIAMLMRMGMVSGNGVDVSKNYDTILQRANHAIELLQGHTPVPPEPLPYADYLDDIAYFQNQHARITILKTAMFHG